MTARALRADELEPGEKTSVIVGTRRILVVRTPDGEYHAVADACPHQGARLSEGHLGGEFGSNEVGEYVISRPGQLIRCPWHHFAFDVTTGACPLNPERYRIKVYPVRVVDGYVEIDA